MRAKLESTIITWKSRASNLIVLVKSEVKHGIFNKKFDFKAIFFKRNLYRKMIVSLLAIYRGIDSEYSNQSNYSICNSILV